MEKYKLTTTLKLMESLDGSLWRTEELVKGLGVNLHPDQEINLLDVLGVCGIADFFRAFEATKQEGYYVNECAAAIAVACVKNTIGIFGEKFPSGCRLGMAANVVEMWFKHPDDVEYMSLILAGEQAEEAIKMTLSFIWGEFRDDSSLETMMLRRPGTEFKPAYLSATIVSKAIEYIILYEHPKYFQAESAHMLISFAVDAYRFRYRVMEIIHGVMGR